MAARRPKDIGTAGESAVVAFLRTAGFPHAERAALAGSADRGDITGTPGIAWEVKAGAAARAEQAGAVERWLAETEVERLNAGSHVGVLVMARAGYGAQRIGWWWAVVICEQVGLPGGYEAGTVGTPAWLRLADAAGLLRRVGYGEPPVRGGGATTAASVRLEVAGALRGPIPAPRAGEPLS